MCAGPDKTLLALDTATRCASVAVARGGRVLAEGAREVTTHSEGLLPLIEATLTQAGLGVEALDAVACGQGPGSFTGLRIGLSTAKGLCLALGRPLICVSSLLALARAVEAAEGDAAQTVAALIDARRKELYLGLYRGGALLAPEAVVSPGAVPALLLEHAAEGAPVVLVGDGALAYQEQLLVTLQGRATLAPERCHALSARHLLPAAFARLAAGETDDLARAVPRYLRSSDAKLPSKPFAGLGGGQRLPRRAAAAAAEASDPEAALLEQLRETGLKLDRQGRWWHEGQLVEHPRLVAALHRWLDRDEQGRYVLRLDADRTARVEVEDAPYIVRTLELDGPGRAVRIYLHLSDDSEEELDYASLRVGGDNALYCGGIKGRFEARFSRQAYYLLGELIEATEEGFALRAAGELWPIGSL
jgi:tRNA threonylcarbamoyl adenosine modification protein YeaZ